MQILRNIFYLIIAVTPFISCLLKDDSLTRNSWHTHHFETSNYVFLTYDSTYYRLFSNANSATLNTFEQSKLDSLLKTTVSEYNAKVENVEFQISNLDSYYFQLIPIMNVEGQKEVWINALCRVTGVNWKQGPIVIQDGGSCYFNVKINLSKSLAYDLMVSGEA